MLLGEVQDVSGRITVHLELLGYWRQVSKLTLRQRLRRNQRLNRGTQLFHLRIKEANALYGLGLIERESSVLLASDDFRYSLFQLVCIVPVPVAPFLHEPLPDPLVHMAVTP